MRATINYSVDTEKIPGEIRKLCREAFVLAGDLPDLEEEWDELLDVGGYENAHEVLRRARADLVAIDARFADCQNILLDYQRILLSKKIEEEKALRAKQMTFDFPTEEPIEHSAEEADNE